MNTIAAILLAAALGPSGAPQTEPFLLNDEYRADYAVAEVCEAKPKDADSVKIGDRAVYVVSGEKIEVMLDEYARRFALDYCWQ
jgi:hypothetical protein